MLTKLRSLPCSLSRCRPRSPYSTVSARINSPTVLPLTAIESCRAVYCLNGVGIRILAMLNSVLPKFFTQVLLCRVRKNGHDHPGSAVLHESAADLSGRHKVGTGRNPDQQRFVARQSTDHPIRILRLDPEI